MIEAERQADEEREAKLAADKARREYQAELVRENYIKVTEALKKVRSTS